MLLIAQVQWTTTELTRHKLPTDTATNFVMLKDLHGGLDGRCWMACTAAGRTCVFKFARKHQEPEQVDNEQERLRHEAEIYDKQGIQTRLLKVGGHWALMMPHFTPIDLNEHKKQVSDAVRSFAKLGLLHQDMKTEHVMWSSPHKKVVLIDLASVEVTLGEEEAFQTMMRALNLGD